MKCYTNPKYSKYVSKFDKLAKNMNINMKTHSGKIEFGKACNYYVNNKRCIHKLNKHEHLRHIIFIILKVLWVILLIIYLIFSIFQIKNVDNHIIKEIDEKIESVLAIFTGIILLYFFIPIFPRPVLSQTDVLITFSGGFMLILFPIIKLINEMNEKKEIDDKHYE